MEEVRRNKEENEGRMKNEEGRSLDEEGRRKKVEGIRKEERSDVLSNYCEVGVGRLNVDRLRVVERVGEFLHNLLGSRAVLAKMARLFS